jgi:hypothetical protein
MPDKIESHKTAILRVEGQRDAALDEMEILKRERDEARAAEKHCRDLFLAEGVKNDAIESHLAESGNRLRLIEMDYKNIERDMSEYLGRPFKSHATDAMVILFGRIRESENARLRKIIGECADAIWKAGELMTLKNHLRIFREVLPKARKESALSNGKKEG